MGDENPIRTLREYSKPSHEGYRNTIELPIGNNVSLRIRTNTSRTSLNLWTHLTLTVQIGKECACFYFNFPFVIKLAIGLNVFLQDPSPHGRILLLVSLFNSFHRGRTVKLRNDILMFQQHHGESLSEAWTRPSPQPQALGTTFEAQELTTSRIPEKVLIREEAEFPITKNPTRTEMVIPLKEAKKNNETKNELIKKAEKEETTEAPSSQPGAVYEAILRKKITRKDDIRGNFEIPGNIGGLKGIAEDILVEVVEHVYHVDFVILDIKEVEKRPFILRTPFLTTAKSVIKFDKGTITLRSGKSKISFHRIPESPCKIEKGVKNDIEPIALIMTVKRLVLEWEERIKLHHEKEKKFNQWRSKNFKSKHPALVKVEGGMNDEGEVTPGNGVTSSTHAVIKPTFMMASQPFHDGVSSIRLARRSSKITHDGFFD
ncbi:hypothetical protein Tco_0194759 [Tanacetum coccineum]